MNKILPLLLSLILCAPCFGAVAVQKSAAGPTGTLTENVRVGDASHTITDAAGTPIGNAAFANIGTASGTVAAGNDARLGYVIQKTFIYTMGDSLTENGAWSNRVLTHLSNAWTVARCGVGGNVTAQMLDRFQREVIDPADASYVIILGGTNDIQQGYTAATAQANLQSMYTLAHNAGAKVVAVSIPPQKGSSAWSSAHQTQLEALNAWILSSTPTGVDYKIDAYTLLQDPANPQYLLPAYDSGDYIHLSNAGYNALGDAIYAAVTWTPSAATGTVGTAAMKNIVLDQDLTSRSRVNFKQVTLDKGTVIRPSLVLVPGAVTNTPVAGAIENDGTALYFTDATATRRDITNLPQFTAFGVGTAPAQAFWAGKIQGGLYVSDRISVGSTARTAGYVMDIGGPVYAVTTVNQNTTPSFQVSQVASTLIDGTANTGTDTTMATQWLATKIVAAAADTMGDFRVRVKAVGTITNPTNSLTGYVYADDGGSPSKPTGAALATGRAILFGSLSSSYQILSLGTRYTMTAGNSYWLVVKYSAAPTGGTIVFDCGSTANGSATSSDGSSWTNTSTPFYHNTRGRTYAALVGNSTDDSGTWGISTNGFGVYGQSSNASGVSGTSTNSSGVSGDSANNSGVVGTSTNGFGVSGASTNSFGVSGTSAHSAAGAFSITGALGKDNTSNALLVRRIPTLGNFNVSGVVLQVTDAPTGSTGGAASGALISGSVDGTTRFNFNPRTSDIAGAVLLMVDSSNSLTAAGGKLLSMRNAGTEKFAVSNDGSLLSGGVTIGVIGKTLTVASGTDALAGTVTLSGGAATITSAAIDANTVIVLSLKTASGTPGALMPRVDVAAGSATVAGAATDNSTYNWVGLKLN